MPLPAKAESILRFWTELGPQAWYSGGEALDAEINDRFRSDWQSAANGDYLGWQTGAEGVLAYLILTDQFPRNMFRNDARAFATDAKARVVATRAWQHGIDLQIDAPLRQFFYVPFMHSENAFDQDRCVSLMAARMPAADAGNLLHARAHREIIRRYRRFPYRNKALGRISSQDETRFIEEGGYGEIVRALGG